MFVRTKKVFDFTDDGGMKRRLPVGWQGELDDAIANKAIEGGSADKIEGDAAKTGTGSLEVQSRTASTVKPGGERSIMESPNARPKTESVAPVKMDAGFQKFDQDGDGKPGGAVQRAPRKPGRE